MTITRARAVAVLLLATAGCGGRVPTTHYYVLEPPDLSRQERPAERGLAVGVEPFRVDAPYDRDTIVYRVGDGTPEVGFYAYHRWAAPLERMLQGVVAAAYDGVPGCRLIEPVAAGRDYDVRLDGRVHKLQEVDTPSGTRVELSLTLRLRASDGSELWTATLHDQAVVSSDRVADVVTQMRATLVHALEASRAGLQAALARASR